MFMVLCIVATPFVFTAWLVQRVLDHRAQIAALRNPAPQPALPAYTTASPEVEQRLANLEAIVASLDFDLAVKVREAARAA
jgi:hypothetical protein